MKNTFKKKATALLSLVLSATLCFTTACGNKGNNSSSSSGGEQNSTGSGNTNVKTYDNETDALIFSSQAVDKVFNPFFATNAADSNVAGMTQLGMLGNDKDGNYTWGDDEEVITKDLGIVYDSKSDTTTYYFSLKNNIKFSNGSPLTIKDVLFNYYVYLDPAYTGSSTIYSTDIVGLKAYRTQSENESEQKNFNTQFQTKASARIQALVTAITAIGKKDGSLNASEIREELVSYLAKNNSDANAHIVEDYDKVVGTDTTKGLFREELESDYTTATGTYSEIKFYNEDGDEVTKDKNGKSIVFTTDAQAFFYNEGLLTWNKKKQEMTFALNNDFSEAAVYDKDEAIEAVFALNTSPANFLNVIQYWATASSLNEYLANAEMEAFFKQSSGSRTVKNISGIKFANKDDAITFVKKKYTVDAKGNVSITDDGTVTYPKASYNADGSVANNEVLSITINGVDPKAIWNFGIGVAPMYYYSDSEHIAKFDYVENFGVEFGSQSFLSDVVNSSDKIGVPVGAGAYAASKASGGIENIKASDFCDNGNIYFERNPYYDLGKSGFTAKAPDGKTYKSAKIKKIRYSVVSEQRMVDNLKYGSIDFAEPNAKPETLSDVKSTEGLDAKTISTSGYGYIGINAGKVPSVYVRRAIMYTIDTSLTVSYYGTMADPIYRSMSKNNWAYPKNSTSYYPYIAGKIPADLSKVDPDYKEFVESKGKKAGQTLTDSEQKEFIQSLVTKGGYKLVDGIYQKSGSNGTEKLAYTFTVAGETQDHPAWNAMATSARLLNRWGFDITVTTKADALSLLSSGGLTVWAAAWGSTIDPDMYQVYHKDSKATSVLNWGYKQILQNSGNKYKYELNLITELSGIIDEARKTDVKASRQVLYSEALDLVMELAVELPTYQRQDMFAYNNQKIDASTFNQNTSSYKGLTSDLTSMSLRVK